MEVIIKRVDKAQTWGAKDPKTGKLMEKYDNCKDNWVPGINAQTGSLRTGLTEQEAREFEKKLNLQENELAPTSKFWDLFKIIIPEKGLILDNSDPWGALKIKVLEADPLIAKSEEEEDSRMDVEYLMTSRGKEARSKNSKRDVIANAYATFAKLTETEITEALYMFGKDPGTTDMEVCKDVLYEILEKSPENFLSVIGDKLFKDKVWVIKCIRQGLVRKNGPGLGYDMPLTFGDISLGKGLEETIEFLKDKENQSIYIALKKAYEAALKK